MRYDRSHFRVFSQGNTPGINDNRCLKIVEDRAGVLWMVEEGFSEQEIIEALSGGGRILEDYPDESRCLILGFFSMSERVSCPLHVVCDYSAGGLIDIVTAYIPERPWWDNPTKRGRIQ